jgi:hypothetical protein
MTSTPLARALAAGALAASTLLAACGGGDPPAPGPAPLLFDGVSIITPLYADDGSVMPSMPQAEPADPGARVKNGRYALRAQAEALDAALPGRVVWVDVDCCAALSVDHAVALAAVLQLTLGLAKDAPVFVSGRDQRLAARAVDAIHDAAMTQVWLVVD